MGQQARADMISALSDRDAWRDVRGRVEPRTGPALMGMMAALDAVRRPGIVIDPSARVVCRNESASAVMGGGLVISRGRLRAAFPGADAALQALLLRVTSEAKYAEPAPPLSVALPTGDAKPLIVQAAALDTAYQDIFGDAKALVTVNRLERPSQSAIRLLGEAFGLTLAEQRLAVEMASGAGLVAASATLGVALSTVRTHLRSIFVKTQTHSQSELAALLAVAGHGVCLFANERRQSARGDLARTSCRRRRNGGCD